MAELAQCNYKNIYIYILYIVLTALLIKTQPPKWVQMHLGCLNSLLATLLVMEERNTKTSSRASEPLRRLLGTPHRTLNSVNITNKMGSLHILNKHHHHLLNFRVHGGSSTACNSALSVSCCLSASFSYGLWCRPVDVDIFLFLFMSCRSDYSTKMTHVSFKSFIAKNQFLLAVVQQRL